MKQLLRARALAIPGRLESLDLNLEAGQRIAVIGPNGGGKTSLLRAIAGVESAGGDIWIEGSRLADCPSARRAQLLAFVPATRDLVWPISVADLLRLGYQHVSDGRVDLIVELFELSSFADRRADMLSTGERARVLLARALIAQPRLFLLDEPFANLDPYWVNRALDALAGAVTRDRSTALIVLHDLRLVQHFDRVLLISEGRVRFDGPPRGLMKSPAFEQAFRLRFAEAT